MTNPQNSSHISGKYLNLFLLKKFSVDFVGNNNETEKYVGMDSLVCHYQEKTYPRGELRERDSNETGKRKKR